MSFLKFVFENKSQTTIPNGYKITHKSGKTFIKENGSWFNVSNNKKLDYKSSLIITEQAIRQINEDSKPVMYQDERGYNIMREPDGSWVHAGTLKELGQEEAKKYEERYQKEYGNSSDDSKSDSEQSTEGNKGSSTVYKDDRGYNIIRNSDGSWVHGGTQQKLSPEEAEKYEKQYQKDNNSSNTNDSAKSDESTSDKPASAAPDSIVTDPNVYQDDRGYNIVRNPDGSWVHAGTLKKLSPEESEKYEKLYQRDNDSLSGIKDRLSSSDDSSADSDKSSSSADSSTGTDTSTADAGTPSDTTTSTDSEPETTDDNSSIPNGYIYTSGKGNKFMYKNGTWFNLANKKPVNPSNVNMLNTSAKKAIDAYNAKNDIKIGAKVTSKSGVEYTYNGSGFTSADGKILSGGAAQSAMNKLKSQNASSGSSQDDQSQGSTDTSADPASSEPKDDELVPGQSALDTQGTGTPPSTSTDSSTDAQDTSSTDYNAQSIISGIGDSGNSGNNQGSSDNSSTTTSSTQGSGSNAGTPPSNPQDGLTKLAQEIKSNQYNKQIITLLSRGSDVDLIAADILLKGNIQEVIRELQSLNNSNTQ